MAQGDLIFDYLTNMRALLSANPSMFKMMVERQVMSRLLPKIKGTRHELEHPLWELLIFCLDGAQAKPPELSNEMYLKAQQAANTGYTLEGEHTAHFPKAAFAVTKVLSTLRESGTYATKSTDSASL
jgi:hypothetical protein